MKRYALLFFVVTLLAACTGKKKPVDYVDPFIGTGGHGHTFPGATTPFGMVQLSPDTRKDSWDGCSGYHFSDSTIMGFSHTHLSGTGVGDYGDIRFMPTTGKLQLDPGPENDPSSGYRSAYNHENESAEAGYYSVRLSDYQIDVELTTTTRAGFHKYTFPKGDTANIIIDLFEGVTSDEIKFLEFQFLDDQTVTGIRKTDGWADNQWICFYAEFSEPFDDFGIRKKGRTLKTKNKVYGENLKGFVRYFDRGSKEILVKVGISPVDVVGAKNNLAQEIPDWDFDKIRKMAREAWSEKLEKIEVEGDESKMTVFYTALYHAYIAPNIFSDADGRYRAHDRKIYTSDFDVYTVFSLWDTFRAEHPLLTILEPELTNDFIRTMFDQFEKGGLLPVWELAGNETNCMIGYHSIPVIADAYIKGIRGYDVQRVYDAMRYSATQDHFGLSFYKKYGYIPADREGESVSKTLEYAYDDWCIAQMAKELERENEYRRYIMRAQYYKNIFDEESGFMRAKRNGMFITPFDPTEVNFTLTEANTWQYNFFVPQDVSGLMELYGGRKEFIKKLDEMFATSSELAGRHQSDITGLIGQYAHGNEPSHHMAYLYNYAAQPWKTQEMVHRICTEQYSDQPAGLCGNEDCGQMSAWYVMSALGFYQLAPGEPVYSIGSPQFKKAVIHLDNGNEFVIRANEVSDDNFYIAGAKMNGEIYPKSFFTHEQLISGGELNFEMSDQPNKDWGSGEGNYPVREISNHLITAVPYFEAESHAFTGEMEIRIKNIYEDADIHYSLDGSEPTTNSSKYSEPLWLKETTGIKAFAVKDGLTKSKVVEATFNKISGNKKVYLQSEYSSQYTGGGKVALIDGIRGGDDFRSFGWQGYHGDDFEVVIDLGKVKRVHSVGAGFLQEQKSWIFMPEKITVFTSRDGKNYRLAGTDENTISPKYTGSITDELVVKNIDQGARYVKLIAQNIGTCPGWHPGAGEKAWLFVDEVLVK